MVKAFVFGKFLPFHKGHEAMIRFALSKCDFLTVLICCSDKENIPDTVRSSWIKETFEHEQNVEVRTFNYLESEFPNTSVSSESVSKIWADIFKEQFPGYSLLITSEEYGAFVANFMDILHIPFDNDKQMFPVSASAIRKDLFANWKFLPDSVKPDFALKVVILGTESTGKTTMTEMLANHFHCSYVSEAGRDIIANSNEFHFEDLHTVVAEHAKRINKAMLADSPLVVIDTDIHTTKSYSRFTFERELEVSAAIYNSNRASLYLYLNNDVDFYQDGTRLMETERNLLDRSHRLILEEHHIEFVEIKGNWDERFVEAVEQVNELIAPYGKR